MSLPRRGGAASPWSPPGQRRRARVAYEGLRPLLEVKDPQLSQQIAGAFTALQTQTEPQRMQLSDAVNTLGEPLSQMTAAITL